MNIYQGNKGGAVMYKKVTSAAKIIPPDNNEFLSGSVKLMFNPGTAASNITRLTNSFSNYPEIQIFSTSYIKGNGSSVGLFISKPIPLYQILYKMAVVQQVASNRNELQIITRADCSISSSPQRQRFSKRTLYSTWTRVSSHFGI